MGRMRSIPKVRRSRRPAADAAGQQLADWTGDSRVFVPQGYEAGYDYPLLVWLTEAGSRFDLGRAMTRLSLRNYLAVEPAAGETAMWRAIDRVRDRLSVHPRRIWLVGHAAGGTAAFRIACRNPDAFAGAVSLGGWFPLGESAFSQLDAVRRMPMLLCCRAAAVTAQPERTDQTLRLFHAAGATLAMRIYQEGKMLSRETLGDVNRWLMDELCGSTTQLQPHRAV
jgi:pimeloyl-ACP methyl ester carboxylesterase